MNFQVLSYKKWTLKSMKCKKADFQKLCFYQVNFQWKLKQKYDILCYVVLIILGGKIEVATNYKISYFGFNFD